MNLLRQLFGVEGVEAKLLSLDRKSEVVNVVIMDESTEVPLIHDLTFLAFSQPQLTTV